MLRGRQNECEMLDRLLEAVRTGESRVLVVRGEPGAGKSALVNHLVGQAVGFQVARAAGVQAEMEMTYAALHQLCAPMLDRLELLPEPQQDALRTAFGLQHGSSPERFLVGLAVLGLFAAVAQEGPLVCVVDDAQWLDPASAQALAFAARRLRTEAVAMVFASREHHKEAAGTAELVVAGLGHDDARALLAPALLGPVDERVLDRIIAETRGNPLALLELPRELTSAELAGGFRLPGSTEPPSRIEESLRLQLGPLPTDTRQLLLIAAAEPLGDPVLVWRAAERIGIGGEALAAGAGLVDIGAQVRFRHPLLRTALHRAATPAERQSVHRALAEVVDPVADPDHRAWHRAQAANGFDEDVAVDLERSLARAQERGGLAAAAAFLERAAHLTLEPARRAERALAAAQAMRRAGASKTALELLSMAAACPLDQLQHAREDMLRAQIEFDINRGRDAASLLLKAAEQLEPLDGRLARETYLDALAAAAHAGSLATGGGIQEVAEAARGTAPAPRPPRSPDLLLDGLATRFAAGYPAGTPKLQRAVHAFLDPALPAEEGFRWLWQAHVVAGDLGNDTAWDLLATRYVHVARDSGAIGRLPCALNSRITAHVLLGDLTAAASLLEELRAATAATRGPAWSDGALLLAAWRGREDESRKLSRSTSTDVTRRGEGLALVVTKWAEAVLYNGLGRYEAALSAAIQASDDLPQEMSLPVRGTLTELIEAATRSGRLEQVPAAFERLTQLARPNNTDWVQGLEARSRALLSGGPDADDAYRLAIMRLGRTRLRGELARAHLLYGEWLRRERRRMTAREHLRTALDMFRSMGMEAFAERAARELQATGMNPHKRSIDSIGELTAQEAQISRLARGGLSNPEIAARLFISPRTVEWHMSKIFAKLGISSRRDLSR